MDQYKLEVIVNDTILKYNREIYNFDNVMKNFKLTIINLWAQLMLYFHIKCIKNSFKYQRLPGKGVYNILLYFHFNYNLCNST